MRSSPSCRSSNRRRLGRRRHRKRRKSGFGGPLDSTAAPRRRPRRRFGRRHPLPPPVSASGGVLAFIASALDKSLPVLEHRRRVAVDLEPGSESSNGPRCINARFAAETSRDRDSAAATASGAALGIAARDRQPCRSDDRLLGWTGPWAWCARNQVAGVILIVLVGRVLDRFERTTLAARHQAERKDIEPRG